MNDSIIVNVINGLIKDYQDYRDNGKRLIERIATKITNAYDDERNYILDFFLREIRNNNNKMEHLSLDVIEILQLKELAPSICQMYKDINKEKDFEWKWHVITMLMKLGYEKPQELYYNYVIELLNNDKWGRSFLLLVWYGFVNSNKSLSLLTDYYYKCYMAKDQQMQIFLSNSMTNLVSSYHYRDFNYVINLIKAVYVKDNEAGIHLQKDIVNFMNSNWIERGNYDKQAILRQQESVLKAINNVSDLG